MLAVAILGTASGSVALLSACYTAVDTDSASSKRVRDDSNQFVPTDAATMPPIPEGAGPAPPRPSTPQDSGGGGGPKDSGQDTGVPNDSGSLADADAG